MSKEAEENKILANSNILFDEPSFVKKNIVKCLEKSQEDEKNIPKHGWDNGWDNGYE